MKRLILSTLTAAILGVSAAASADNLSIGFADPLSSLDPQLNNHAGDRSVALHFWDLLIENKWNKLQPGLAVSWKPLDSTTWEFKLREGVKWQDGTPFTADDLIYSYTRARAVPGSVATYAGYLRTIDTMTAKDPLTLIVKTKAPNPDLPLNLASVHVVSKHVGEKSTTEDYNSGKAMVGTGPYKFVSYTPGDRVLMERNDGYWGEKATWDKVNYRYINNAAARTAALLAGDVDVIDKVSVSDLAKLQKAPNVSVYPYDGLRVMILQPSFNPAPNQYITDNNGKPLDKNPLLDVRVRQALNLAINRKAIADRILQGAATEANQWMPKGTFGYNPDVKDIPNDVEQAKKLLAAAGFPDGFKLTMHVPNDRYPQGPETPRPWRSSGPASASRRKWKSCRGPCIRAAPTRTNSPSACWRGATARVKPATRWSTSWPPSTPRRAWARPTGATTATPRSMPRWTNPPRNSTWPSVKPSCATRSSWWPMTSASSRCTTTRTSGPPRRA